VLNWDGVIPEIDASCDRDRPEIPVHAPLVREMTPLLSPVAPAAAGFDRYRTLPHLLTRRNPAEGMQTSGVDPVAGETRSKVNWYR
jgi:hypothetical protein